MAVTAQQIAELAGVSRGTVDRALHNRGRVNPEVAAKIHKIAAELGYKPNLIGQALVKSRREFKLGAILQSTETPTMQIVRAGVQRAAEELAGGVVSGVREFSSLDDIADRHQAGELELIVNDQNALETMLVHQSLGFFEGGALLHNDEAFAGGHDGGNRHILAVFEADVAVRHHAENRAVFSDNRETGDAAHTGETKHVSNRHIRTDGDRIIHDTGFETLHLADFSCLGLSGHILVNNADATLFSESNSETGFSNRIHGCRNERNVERDFARQLGFQGSLSGKHIGVRRNEKNVIERECSLKESHG